MASLPSPSVPADLASELECLYARRNAVEQLIQSLERYAVFTGKPELARRPPARVILVPKRQAR